MGIVELDSIEDYWYQDSERLGNFAYAQYMTLNCFEDLKRFLHISSPKPQVVKYY